MIYLRYQFGPSMFSLFDRVFVLVYAFAYSIVILLIILTAKRFLNKWYMTWYGLSLLFTIIKVGSNVSDQFTYFCDNRSVICIYLNAQRL